MAPRAWVRRADMMTQMRGKWGYALAVGALSPMAYILVLYALQRGAPVSLVAPLRETSLMIATVAGFFILKEKASAARVLRSEEHTSELQSLMRISYAVFCLKKKNSRSNSNTPQNSK